MTNPTTASSHVGWKIAIAIILVLSVLGLIIPGIRASISSWLGLSVAPSTQVPASAIDLVAITPDIAINPTEAATQTQYQTTTSTEGGDEFKQFSAQAGWNTLVPGELPEGYRFQSAFFDTNNKMIILTYLVTRPLPGAADPSLTSSETITLLQSQRNDFVPMQIAPNTTNVTDIQVNGMPAAFTVGGWDTEFVKDSSEPNGGRMVSSWRNDLPVKNLYWQVEDIYLALITADETVGQQDLIEMATSIGN